MREIVNCLREYKGLAEALQPAYLVRMGALLTTNTATFPDITFDGAVISGHAGTLLTKFGLKETSETAMTAYTTERDLVITKVDKDYDYIDLIAQGDAAIVAKAGVRGTSTNTASTGVPLTPSNLKFSPVDAPAQMMVSHDFDKLAFGTLYITSVDIPLVVEATSDTQLTVTTGDGKKILLDVDTASRTIIKNVAKKTELFTTAVLFNPNGISPMASPTPIVVGK